MATIVTRSGKGSALTFAEGDANFTNLNNDKIELTDLSVGAEGSASGNGAISYNSGTGVFTYIPPVIPSAVSELTNDSGYITDYTVTQGDVTQHQAALSITESQISDFGTYLTSYTETDPVVGAINGLVKANGAGTISAAVAGTDYLASETFTSLVQDTTPQLGGALDCQGNDVRDATLEDYKETIHSLGSTDSPTITVSNGNVQSVTISSGLSLPAFSDAAAGQSVTLLVSGSGTASGTAAYKFAGGNTTLTTSSVVSIFYDGTTYWTSIATDFQ